MNCSGCRSTSVYWQRHHKAKEGFKLCPSDDIPMDWQDAPRSMLPKLYVHFSKWRMETFLTNSRSNQKIKKIKKKSRKKKIEPITIISCFCQKKKQHKSKQHMTLKAIEERFVSVKFRALKPSSLWPLKVWIIGEYKTEEHPKDTFFRKSQISIQYFRKQRNKTYTYNNP